MASRNGKVVRGRGARGRGGYRGGVRSRKKDTPIDNVDDCMLQ
jgi:hypothetical protein